MKSQHRRRPWQDEFDVASAVLKDEPGTLEWATDDHVAFRYREPDARLVFYPHRTSARHYHIRIRDEGSKDKRRFHELAARLFVGSGASCTFQVKNGGTPTPPAGLEYGWAAKQALGRAWI